MLDRRKFLKSTGALAALSMVPFSGKASGLKLSNDKANPVILPKKLKKGDTIGLITPSAPITKEQLNETVKKLEKLGFKTYYKDSVLSEYGYFAGKDQERADELMSMFTNKEVDGILSVRGGYGAIRILDMLDYEAIKQNPKVFMGFSDITAFLNAIYSKTGLVTFHGPLGISTYTDFSWVVFKSVAMEPKSRYLYPYFREPDEAENPEFDLYTINSGKATGNLIGGNISVLDSMTGTEFEPDFADKIVILEEVEEKTYKVDKMLVHLLQATNLKDAAGIAFGTFKDCNINDEPKLTLKQAIEDLFKPLDMPIIYGLPFGHILFNITIPLGIRAQLNANKNTLKLLDFAVG
jgi:muramoyltetrapeptide carboxypeptidase